MKRVTILAIVTFFASILIPAAVIGNPAGPPGGLDVKIVNPIPLPITGDVNATVSGNVNVGQPNVTVVNDAASPVIVSEVGAETCDRTYERLRGQATTGGPGLTATEVIIGLIPSGEAYVIESAYFRIASDPTDSVFDCQITENIPIVGGSINYPVAHLAAQLTASLSAANVRVASIEGRIVIIGDEQGLGVSVSHAFNVDYVINGYWIDADCAQP